MKKTSSLVYITIALSFYLAITGNDSYDLLPKHFELNGFSPATTGLIMSFTGLGGMLILPFLFFVVDVFKKKSILTAALLLQAVIPLFYLVPLPQNVLYAVPRLFQGSMAAVVLINFTTVQSYVIPPEKRSRGFALFGIMGQLGLFSSILFGEILYDAFGFLALYLFTAVIFIGAAIVLQFFPENKYLEKHPLPRFSDFLTVLRQKEVYPALFWIFILGSGFGTILSFLPKVVLDAGLKQIRPFYIAFPITVIILRFTVSSYFDRLHKHTVLFLPLLLLPLSLALSTFIKNYTVLIITGILYGFSHGILFPVLLAYLIDYSPFNFRGRMSLLFQLFFNLGIFISSNIGGILAGYSVSLTFFVMAGCTSAGILLLICLHIVQRLLSK